MALIERYGLHVEMEATAPIIAEHGLIDRGMTDRSVQPLLACGPPSARSSVTAHVQTADVHRVSAGPPDRC